MDLILIAQTMDRPLLAPPGVPAERVKELRDAFAATVKDPAFLAEVARRNLQLDPMRGEDMTVALNRAYAAPEPVVAAARKIMGGR
jgi:tripartite-type tricarboxylate transporter receptor subunit TctC